METSAITWTITPAAEAGAEGVSLRVTLGERAAEVSLPARDSHDLSRALRGPCADVSLDLWDVDHEGDRVWLTLYRTVRGMVRVSTIELSVSEAQALARDLERHVPTPPQRLPRVSAWNDVMDRWLRPAGQLMHRIAG